MNATKVLFADRDEILAAVVRALAAKTTGFQIVTRMNDNYLHQHGCYVFNFSNQEQVERFITLVNDYVPDRWRERVKIEPTSGATP